MCEQVDLFKRWIKFKLNIAQNSKSEKYCASVIQNVYSKL